MHFRYLHSKFILLLVLLALFNHSAIGQDSTYTYSFNDFNKGQITLGDSVKLWVDPTGSVTLKEVISKPFSQFSKNKKKVLSGEKDAIWANFKLRNTSINSCQVAIMFCDLADSIRLFAWNERNECETLYFSLETNPRTRPVLSVNRILEINIGPNEVKTFYAKIHLKPLISSTHFNHIYVNSLQTMNQQNTEKFMIQAFFSGVMVLFSLVSFIMYWSFKEKMFMQFGILMICLMVYFLTLHRLMNVFVTHNMPLVQTYLANVAVGIINISMFYFVRDYINLKSLYPKYHNVLRFFTFLVAISAIVPKMLGFALTQVALINNILMILWIFGIIYPVVLQTIKKDKAARTLLISIGILFFGALLLTLSLLNVIPQTSITKNGMQIGTVMFSSVLFYGLFQKINVMRMDKLRIGLEKEKSDALLENILPTDVATQLKESGSVTAQKFDLATVLFTDFKGFTQMSAKLKPTEIIEELNVCFSAFDAICEKYKVEKIKTIGDAYMAVGGIPMAKNDSVKNTVLTGIEMVNFINNRQISLTNQGKLSFQMRVGIHSGAIVAGIVGTKKFHYDIWGDTVNTASRMESSGDVGKVNISHATYQLIKDEPGFIFESRGKIDVKGKGAVEMWFVSLKLEVGS